MGQAGSSNAYFHVTSMGGERGETENMNMYVSKSVRQGPKLQGRETLALKGSHQYSSPSNLGHTSQLGLQSFGPRVCQAGIVFFSLSTSQRDTSRLDLQRGTLTHKLVSNYQVQGSGI